MRNASHMLSRVYPTHCTRFIRSNGAWANLPCSHGCFLATLMWVAALYAIIIIIIMLHEIFIRCGLTGQVQITRSCHGFSWRGRRGLRLRLPLLSTPPQRILRLKTPPPPPNPPRHPTPLAVVGTFMPWRLCEFR
jgi:hypothetical protein